MTSDSTGNETTSHGDGISRHADGLQIRVAGLQEEDVFIRDGIYNEAEGTLKKLASIMTVSDFTLNVKKHHDTGKRKKYSVRIRVLSDKGSFRADDYEWDIFKAVKKTLEKLEREVYRDESKSKSFTISH